METPLFNVHHLGIAVADLNQALAFYQSALGFQITSGPFVDPIQKVSVCFIQNRDGQGPLLELICPTEAASPVTGLLAKGTGAYHVCYEVKDLEETLDEMRSRGSVVVSNPQPAVAFGGRRIAWCFLPTKHLAEFVELELLSR